MKEYTVKMSCTKHTLLLLNLTYNKLQSCGERCPFFILLLS